MSKGREFDHSKYSLWIDPNEVRPYERNAKIHDERQIANIANSIRRFGWQQDTVITRDKVCVIGHGRRLAAIQLGCEMPYHMIDKDADEVTDEDIRELRLSDNLTNSETGYDYGVLDLEIEDLDFDGFDFDFDLHDANENEGEYTKKTDIPQYDVQGDDVSLEQLVNREKALALIEEIEKSNVSEEEKTFLKLAARRHYVFNYKKIAEYYASASEEMQELMERSALVIIDYDNAMANGYIKLSKRLGELRIGDA